MTLTRIAIVSLTSAVLCAAAAPISALNLMMEKWPGSVHPAKTVSLEGVMIANQVYDTLVRQGPNSRLLPSLAESWSYDEKTQQLHFKLREGIRFSSGKKLTAQHIRSTFEGIISNKVFRNLDKISGAKAFRDGKTRTLSGFKIKNDREFSIQFDFFYPKFLEELADPYACVYLEEAGKPWPTGTGPYKLESVNEGLQSVKLVRNEYFYGTPAPFSEVILSTSANASTDIALTNPPNGLGHLNREVHYFDTEVYFLGFNSSHPNLKDADVRATLASYLTPAMVDELLGKVSYPVGGFIPLGVLGHSPNLHVPAAGAKKKPKEKVVVWNYLARLLPLAEKYCAALAADGIPCETKTLPVEDFFKKANQGQIFFARQKSTSYSPEYLMSCFVSNNYSNIFTVGSPGNPLTQIVDNAFDRIQETPSSHRSELLALYQAFDAKVVESVLVKPFRYGVDKAVWHSSRVKLPLLDTLGPFSVRFTEIKPTEGK